MFEFNCVRKAGKARAQPLSGVAAITYLLVNNVVA